MNASRAEPAAPGWARPMLGTLLFLAVPGLALAPALLFGLEVPVVYLYFVAACAGAVVAARSLKDPEWLIAVTILYIPYKRLYVVPLAPGINGTNVLLVLLVVACIAEAARRQGAAPARREAVAGRGLMAAYAALGAISMLTAVLNVGAGEFLSSYAQDIKAWLDQFLLFFMVSYLVRDADMARRLGVYLMLGLAAALGSGVSEWLEKRHYNSIERARLLGPQLQPNDFGAFLVYGSAFYVAFLLRSLTRWWAWLTFAPALVILAKMVLATFSRGAYLAMGAMAVAAGWLRGKLLMTAAAVLGAALIALVPEIVPESLRARMSHTGDAASEESLDTSSRTRLVLWQASIDMTLENPLLGKGFKMFPVYKGRYTEYDVEEADNHNMYLYIASQMGVPALLVFVLILGRMFFAGLDVYRRSPQWMSATLGLGAAAMVPAVLVINMFGSRMVDIGVSLHVWLALAMVGRLQAALPPRGAAARAPGSAPGPAAAAAPSR